MKSIKAKLVLIVVVLNALGGAVIMAGMNMAYKKNVQLVTDALGGDASGMVTQLTADMAGNRNRAMIIAVVLAIVMAVVIVMALRSLVFKRVDKVIADATRIVGGDMGTPIKVTNHDEIGEIEADFEKFRVLLADAVGQPK